MSAQRDSRAPATGGFASTRRARARVVAATPCASERARALRRYDGCARRRARFSAEVARARTRALGRSPRPRSARQLAPPRRRYPSPKQSGSAIVAPSPPRRAVVARRARRVLAAAPSAAVVASASTAGRAPRRRPAVGRKAPRSAERGDGRCRSATPSPATARRRLRAAARVAARRGGAARRKARSAEAETARRASEGAAGGVATALARRNGRGRDTRARRRATSTAQRAPKIARSSSAGADAVAADRRRPCHAAVAPPRRGPVRRLAARRPSRVARRTRSAPASELRPARRPRRAATARAFRRTLRRRREGAFRSWRWTHAPPTKQIRAGLMADMRGRRRHDLRGSPPPLADAAAVRRSAVLRRHRRRARRRAATRRPRRARRLDAPEALQLDVTRRARGARGRSGSIAAYQDRARAMRAFAEVAHARRVDRQLDADPRGARDAKTPRGSSSSMPRASHRLPPAVVRERQLLAEQARAAVPVTPCVNAFCPTRLRLGLGVAGVPPSSATPSRARCKKDRSLLVRGGPGATAASCTDSSRARHRPACLASCSNESSKTSSVLRAADRPTRRRGRRCGAGRAAIEGRWIRRFLSGRAVVLEDVRRPASREARRRRAHRTSAAPPGSRSAWTGARSRRVAARRTGSPNSRRRRHRAAPEQRISRAPAASARSPRGGR